MPIYEYHCASCGRRPSLFFRSIGTAENNPACPHCGHQTLQRQMSRFWSRSTGSSDGEGPGSVWEEDGVSFYGGHPDDIGGPEEAMSYEQDDNVVSFAREARQMAQAMGEPLDADFDDALRHIEGGADPDDVLGEMDAHAAETTGDQPPESDDSN